MKPLALAVGLLLAAVLTGAALSGSAGPSSAIPATYSHEVLSRASAMTEQMTASADPAHAYHPHAGDEQLRLSSDPTFVRQLEAYQAAIDRMLAR